RAHPLTRGKFREHTQLGELERRNLDVDIVDLAAKIRIIDQPLAVLLLGSSDRPHLLQSALETRRTCITTFEFQQILRVRPAFILFADEVFLRYANVIKKDLIDLLLP